MTELIGLCFSTLNSFERVGYMVGGHSLLIPLLPFLPVGLLLTNSIHEAEGAVLVRDEG